jgi:hypothetical protein
MTNHAPSPRPQPREIIRCLYVENSKTPKGILVAMDIIILAFVIAAMIEEYEPKRSVQKRKTTRKYPKSFLFF